jgi:hypothetical protein
MKCKNCIYYPKCRDIAPEENICTDFKDRYLFVELPFMVNQLLYYIEPATKYVPVIINGDAYFKLEDDSKIKTHMFDCGELVDYNPPIVPGCWRERRKYYTSKVEAEKALEEVKSRGRAQNVCQDDN